MFDVLFANPGQWMTGNPLVVLTGTLIWGAGSALLSPCHLGIIPLLGSHAAGLGPFDGASPPQGGESSPSDGAPSTRAHEAAQVELAAQTEVPVPSPTSQSAALPNASSPHPVRQSLLFTLGYYLTIPLLGFLLALIGHSLELGGQAWSRNVEAAHYWTLPVGLVLLWLGRDLMRGHRCSQGTRLLAQARRKLGLGPNSGVAALGFGYGLLSSACAVGFLLPLLTLALNQGLAYCTLLAAVFGLGHCLPMAVVGASAPLALRVLGLAPHVHRDTDHDDHAHHHAAQSTGPHAADPHPVDPHRGEARFRRGLGLLIMLIGVLFLLHPFLE